MVGDGRIPNNFLILKLEYTLNNNDMKKLNNIAHRVTKPAKPAPMSHKGATAYLDQNRAGIAKLRRRGFTWGQIADTFQRLGININYNNLYAWQLRRFKQRPKQPTFKKGDIIQPTSKRAGFKYAAVAESNPMRRTMQIVVEGGKMIEVPSKATMFKKIR